MAGEFEAMPRGYLDRGSPEGFCKYGVQLLEYKQQLMEFDVSKKDPVSIWFINSSSGHSEDSFSNKTLWSA